MPKLRLKQLAQDGATNGQVATFNTVTGLWEPATPTGGITGPGSSVDLGVVVWDGTGGTAVADSGLRNYGASATDPTVPTPADGDRYHNTAIDMPMVYDGTRAKWLSVDADSGLWFGRNGNTGGGSYYRGPGNRAYSATQGRRAEYDGTVVSISYTRIDVDAATFEVTASGASLATLASAAVSGSDVTLDADFSAGDILGVRNQAASNTTRHVHGWVRVRWRA